MSRSFQVTVEADFVDFGGNERLMQVITIYIDGKYYDTDMARDFEAAMKKVHQWQVFSQQAVDIHSLEEQEKFFRDWDAEAEAEAHV